MNNEASQKLQKAGGAEREARELHDAIERAHEKWYDAGCHETGCGCVTVYVEREVMPLLVKFANEARLEEALEMRAQYHHLDEWERQLKFVQHMDARVAELEAKK